MFRIYPWQDIFFPLEYISRSSIISYAFCKEYWKEYWMGICKIQVYDISFSRHTCPSRVLDSRQIELIKSYNNIWLVQNLSMTWCFFSPLEYIYQQKFDHNFCVSYITAWHQSFSRTVFNQQMLHEKNHFDLSGSWVCWIWFIFVNQLARRWFYDLFPPFNHLSRRWFYELISWTTLQESYSIIYFCEETFLWFIFPFTYKTTYK